MFHTNTHCSSCCFVDACTCVWFSNEIISKRNIIKCMSSFENCFGQQGRKFCEESNSGFDDGESDDFYNDNNSSIFFSTNTVAKYWNESQSKPQASTEDALIKFGRINSAPPSLRWFRSSSTQHNIKMLRFERPKIELQSTEIKNHIKNVHI